MSLLSAGVPLGGGNEEICRQPYDLAESALAFRLGGVGNP